MNRCSAPSCWNKMTLRPPSFKIGMKLPPMCLDALHQSQHVRKNRTLRRLIVWIEYKRHWTWDCSLYPQWLHAYYCSPKF
jgi:hypothetical protein